MPIPPTPQQKPSNSSALSRLIDRMAESFKDDLETCLHDYVILDVEECFSNISMTRRPDKSSPEIAMTLEKFDGGMTRVHEDLHFFAKGIKRSYRDSALDGTDFAADYWDDMQALIDALSKALADEKEDFPEWEKERDEARARRSWHIRAKASGDLSEKTHSVLMRDCKNPSDPGHVIDWACERQKHKQSYNQDDALEIEILAAITLMDAIP